MQLYILESFLARLAETRFAQHFVLKGGVLLAAFGERRPTRDIDLQAQALDNDPEAIQAAIIQIACVHQTDGAVFDVATATAEVIRDEDAYSGVRVTITARLATARPHFHVDISVGDPITPAPENVHLPRLLGGELVVRGYPLAMVYSEKIVTAIARGTASTRWRDFADVSEHPVERCELNVALHRHVELAPLDRVLADYGVIGQQRWAAWRRKQRLDDRLPDQFTQVVTAVAAFADAAITGAAAGKSWDPATATWSL